MKKDPLGRGLSAILQDIEERGTTRIIPVDQIMPNPSQPRLEMRAEALAELASSIREKGLLQPILVKKADRGYEIIAGERRYRASLMAGLKEMPAIVKDVTEHEALEISMIENLQREDLNPLEVATMYQRFIEEFGYTQQDLARKLGVDRSSVANHVRLLKLPQWIKELIISGKLTQGHARALLALESEREQKTFVERILNEGATVREVEKASKRRRTRRSQFSDLEDTLTGFLQTRVSVSFRKNKGKITIEFYSREDLERLVDMVAKK